MRHFYMARSLSFGHFVEFAGPRWITPLVMRAPWKNKIIIIKYWSIILSSNLLKIWKSGKEIPSCIYCYWDSHERKDQETLSNITIKAGYHWRDCKTNKMRVHCQQKNRHHRSLCISKFLSGKPIKTVNIVTHYRPTTGHHSRGYLASLWWVSTNANSHRRSRGGRSTNTRKTDYQISSGYKNPKNLHHLTASRETPLANREIWSSDSLYIQHIETQAAADTCYRTQAFNRNWSSLHVRVNAVSKIPCTLQRAWFDRKRIVNTRQSRTSSLRSSLCKLDKTSDTREFRCRIDFDQF